MTLGFNPGEDFVTPKALEVIKKSRTQVDLHSYGVRFAAYLGNHTFFPFLVFSP